MDMGNPLYLNKSPKQILGSLSVRIDPSKEIADGYDFDVSVEIINDVDRVLEKLSGVISGDAIILNKCKSWINLVSAIVSDLPDVWVIELMDGQ